MGTNNFTKKKISLFFLHLYFMKIFRQINWLRNAALWIKMYTNVQSRIIFTKFVAISHKNCFQLFCEIKLLLDSLAMWKMRKLRLQKSREINSIRIFLLLKSRFHEIFGNKCDKVLYSHAFGKNSVKLLYAYLQVNM